MNNCKYNKRCGGCSIGETSYDISIKNKQKELNKLFHPFKVEDITIMENPYNYRHKVFATFTNDKRDIKCGIYEEKSHKVVCIEDCLIQNDLANQILKTICKIATKLKIRAYDEDRKIGIIRHVYLRVSHSTNKILCAFVIGQDTFAGSKKFMQLLRDAHQEISSISLIVNKRNTSVVLEGKEKILYGKGYIQDQLCNLTFKLSTNSFYQVNPTQTEKLYQKAIELAKLSKEDNIIDAYCGIGTIGLIAASSVKEVFSVESNTQAIRDAKENAKINNISNISFYNEDATKFIQEFTKQTKRISTVFIDPPRSGSTKEFLSTAVKLKPDKIVYISCNPISQKRDIEILKSLNYKLIHLSSFDLFPFTKHIETIALIVKNNH
ncbi:MAG: 23S rRNA (uracil(1939)-C(5))-methyltransferase RlmD [Anaerorhabdus sp.]